MFCLRKVKRSHVAIWKWIQKYHPRKDIIKGKRISEFIIDETLLKVGFEFIWLWVAIEPENRQILALFHLINPRKETCLLLKGYLRCNKDHGKHPVSTDGGTWYPQACRFLKLNHHIHSSFEKSLIERTMQYTKDRTEGFDDYFPCRMKIAN